MHDGGADLALDVVADDRHAGVGELLGPDRVARDEHRDRVHERHPGVEAALRVVLLRVLGPDREVARRARRPSSRAAPAPRRPARAGSPRRSGGSTCRGRRASGARCTSTPVSRHAREADRVVLAREDRLAEVEADLGRVDVERGDELDVAHVVAAELDVHQPGNVLAPGRRRGSTRRPAAGCWRSCRHRRWRHGSSGGNRSCGCSFLFGCARCGRGASAVGRVRFLCDQIVDPLEVALGGARAVVHEASGCSGRRPGPRARRARRQAVGQLGAPALEEREAGVGDRGSGRTRA